MYYSYYVVFNFVNSFVRYAVFNFRLIFKLFCSCIIIVCVCEVTSFSLEWVLTNRVYVPSLADRSYVGSWSWLHCSQQLSNIVKHMFKLRFNISGSWRPNDPILVMNFSPPLFMEYKGTNVRPMLWSKFSRWWRCQV